MSGEHYYSNEFKLKAVKLYIKWKGQKSIQRIASELNISKTSLNNWILDYRDKGKNCFIESANKPTINKELEDLKKEYSLMKEGYEGLKRELSAVIKERDEFKKAAEVFINTWFAN